MSVADTLGEIVPSTAAATAALVGLLADSEELVRSHAVEALGALGAGRVAIEERLARDASALVRAAAAEALGCVGERASLPVLVAALGDRDRAVRAYAANAVGLVGQAADAALLATAEAKESAPEVLAELYGAEYRLGAADRLPRLLGLLQTADESLAINVLNAIEDLFVRAAPPQLSTGLSQIEAALSAFEKRLPAVRDSARVRAALESFRNGSVP
jgi:hypothetical protein